MIQFCVYIVQVLIVALHGLVVITLLMIILNSSVMQKQSRQSLTPRYLRLTPGSAYGETYNHRSLEAFNNRQRHIMDGQMPLSVSINGVIMNGYGNRMYSVLTSFVIAILTDRALVINWPSIYPFVKEPFYKAFAHFDASTSQFSAAYKPGELFNLSWSHNNWKIKKKLSTLIATQVPVDKRRILYFHIEAEFFSMCSNPMYFEKLFMYGLVERQTIEAASAILADNNADESAKVEKVLRVGFEVGGNLLRNYWLYQDNVTSLVKHYYDTHFHGSYVIGMQIRTEFLTDTDFVQVFGDCALGIEEKLADDAPNVKWFVTSDGQWAIDLIEKRFPNKLIHVNGSIGHIHSNDPAIPKTLLDNELLALCDEMIMTGASSYGWLAAMKAQRLPLFVRGSPNQTQCFRSTLNSPPTRLDQFACF